MRCGERGGVGCRRTGTSCGSGGGTGRSGSTSGTSSAGGDLLTRGAAGIAHPHPSYLSDRHHKGVGAGPACIGHRAVPVLRIDIAIQKQALFSSHNISRELLMLHAVRLNSMHCRSLAIVRVNDEDTCAELGVPTQHAACGFRFARSPSMQLYLHGCAYVGKLPACSAATVRHRSSSPADRVPSTGPATPPRSSADHETSLQPTCRGSFQASYCSQVSIHRCKSSICL